MSETYVSETQQDIHIFKSKLTAYKQLIDARIATICEQLEAAAKDEYGLYSLVSIQSYTDVLKRGGKRIRGGLVMTGYAMAGGQDTDMIVQAAVAVEMVQAYVLIIDDINDRSAMRRGGLSAHRMMADAYNHRQLGEDSQHFGEAIAMNAALLGGHVAQIIMTQLTAPEQARLEALRLLNSGIMVAAHGQFNDLFNQARIDTTEADVEQVIEWKTAHYTLLNPLQIGMVLAGCDTKKADTIAPYALHAGKAYQISDDVLGIFSKESTSGKGSMDDMKEGKKTFLTLYALKHAPHADADFLRQMLGNQQLTEEQFLRCKDILLKCKAFAYAEDRARSHVKMALAALEPVGDVWQPEGMSFLRGLARYLLIRTS